MRPGAADRAAIVLSAILTLAACGGAAPSQPATPPTTDAPVASAAPASAAPATAAPTATPRPTPKTALVEMGDHFFAPAELTVQVGTTVTWRVVGQALHDVAAKDGSFAQSSIGHGGIYSFTFTKPGRYPYVCLQHEGDGMTGEVIVVD